MEYQYLRDKINSLNILKFHQKNINRLKQIGSGGQGVVYMSKFLSLTVAEKRLHNNKLESVIREIGNLKKLKHNYIPQLIGIIDSEKVSIISEIVNGTNLSNCIKKKTFDELENILILLDLVTVVYYLHKSNFIHRDLKPSNIMIDSNNLNLKLLDFGISKESVNTSTFTSTLGTIIYMAPENFDSLEGKTISTNPKTKISSKVDIWAIGCIISELFSGEKPWNNIGGDDNKILGALFQKLNFPVNKNIKHKLIQDLIKNCTRINPQERYDICQIKENLLMFLSKQLSSSFHNISNDNHCKKC